tara:strand:+ start:20612 stop:21901 length:1290 start_codon:yes stop_codon:yes gene_type:complete
MSKITITPNGAGTGTFSIASPNSNTNRTLTLPDSTGELLNAESSLNAAKLTGALPAIDASNVTGIVIPPVFAPVAVTGATPSLNVGTYNYFDNGTLTANTTVSFASVPTNARWTYTFDSTLVASAWDVSTAAFVRKQSSLNGETNPQGFFFKPDGLKIYITGVDSDRVDEYNLSTAWDISTSSYLQGISVTGRGNSPVEVFLKPDGLKMYIMNGAINEIDEYNLSTAWNVTTASYSQSLAVNSRETLPKGIFFKPDGTKLYLTGANGDDVNEYNLSTAWSISTASYSQNFSVSAQDTSPQGIFLRADGLKMFIVGAGAAGVHEYTLSTAWNVTTATITNTFSVVAQYNNPYSVFFKPDGFKMYVLGVFSGSTTTRSLSQYDVGSPATVTLPAAVSNAPTLALVNARSTTYEFVTLDGGTTVKLISEEIV